MQINPEAVVAARRRRGESQEELAARAGISRPSLSYIETGRVKLPHPRTVKLLADALDLAVDDITVPTKAA